MSIHINQVLDYLDKHRACQKAGTMESLLDIVYEAYAEYDYFDSQKVREEMQKLENILDILPLRAYDEVVYLVCGLCSEHEKVAFSQGILAGMNLMTEINCLP